MAGPEFTAPLRYSDITDPIVMSSHSILSRDDLDDHLTALLNKAAQSSLRTDDGRPLLELVTWIRNSHEALRHRLRLSSGELPMPASEGR
jgi:hypothetical protein